QGDSVDHALHRGRYGYRDHYRARLMPKIDIDQVAIDTATGYPPPFNKAVEGRSRKRLARAAGLTHFGVNVCTLKPGAASSQRHWHEKEDEFVYVLQGEVVLCEDSGETVLKPGDAAAWKAGVENGHCLINKSNRDAVFIEVGTRVAAERAFYSDIDMMVTRDDKGARYTKKNGEPCERSETREPVMASFKLDVDSDGIALVTWDMGDRSMNVITMDVIAERGTIVDKVANDAAIKGVVITSGKPGFCGGADLTMLESMRGLYTDMVRKQGEEAAAKLVFDESRKLSQLYRRIETCGKPWVCALNGTAMGGGFELAL